MRLFHPIDAGLMMLVRQFGSVARLAVLPGCVGLLIRRRRHVPAGKTGSARAAMPSSRFTI